jgi:hypothetical protein
VGQSVVEVLEYTNSAASLPRTTAGQCGVVCDLGHAQDRGRDQGRRQGGAQGLAPLMPRLPPQEYLIQFVNSSIKKRASFTLSLKNQ